MKSGIHHQRDVCHFHRKIQLWHFDQTEGPKNQKWDTYMNESFTINTKLKHAFTKYIGWISISFKRLFLVSSCFFKVKGFIALRWNAFESPALPVTVHNKKPFLGKFCLLRTYAGSTWPFGSHCLSPIGSCRVMPNRSEFTQSHTIHIPSAHSPNQKATLKEWNLCVVQCLGSLPVVTGRKEVAFTRILEAIVVYRLEQKFVASGFGPVPCGWPEIWGRSPVQGVCTQRGAFWVTVV